MNQPSGQHTGRPRKMSPVSSTKTSIRGLSIALLLLALPAGVRAQLTYTNTGTSVVITGYSGPDSVDIPAVIEGLPVTEIGSDAFRLSTVTNVTIPNSVIIIAWIPIEQSLG